MAHRRWILLASAVLAAALIGGALIWGTPRVTAVFPEPGAVDVPAGQPLRIEFSRAMRPAAVLASLSTTPPSSGEFTWENGTTLVYAPDRPWPSGATIEIKLESGPRAAGWLSLPLLETKRWSFTVGHPRLLYLYPADSPAEIYLYDPQTGESERLTDSPGQLLDFSASLNGATIYYTTSHGDGGSTIYRLDRLKGETAPLLRCPTALCRYPEISPQGDFLAYERTPLETGAPSNRPQVWLLKMTGAGEAAPYLAGDPTHQTQWPQWSPAGWLTYYNYSLSAFVAQDPNSGETVTFPSQTGIPGCWDPSGERYVFPEIYTNEIADPNILTDLGAIPSSRLLQYDLQGNVRDLTATDSVEDATPVFSPDGQVLAFGRKFLDVARWTPGRQLWLMTADGSAARQMTDAALYNHYDFAWSPDGAQLVYSRFNKNTLTEPPEIWLLNLDGSGSQRLITGGYAPRWIP